MVSKHLHFSRVALIRKLQSTLDLDHFMLVSYRVHMQSLTMIQLATVEEIAEFSFALLWLPYVIGQTVIFLR